MGSAAVFLSKSDLYAADRLNDHAIEVIDVVIGYTFDGRGVHYVHRSLMPPPVAPTGIDRQAALTELCAEADAVDRETDRANLAGQSPQRPAQRAVVLAGDLLAVAKR